MSVAETSLTAPARSRADTRRRLLAAATELFAAEGLHGATSARIARQAGVATGTFYLHFEDKQSLFREIVFDALGELRERQERAAEGAGGGLAEQRARLEELLRFGEERRDLVRILFGRGQAGGSAADEVLDAVVPGIEERLAERVAAAEIQGTVHPRVAARALAEMITRVMAWWVEDPSRAPREQVIDTLLTMHPLNSRHGRT